MGVINRCAEDETVGLPALFGKFIDTVVYDAAVVIAAEAAGSAVGDRLISDEKYFGIYAFLRQRPGHLCQGRICAAVFMGTAVYKKYLHFFNSFL